MPGLERQASGQRAPHVPAGSSEVMGRTGCAPSGRSSPVDVNLAVLEGWGLDRVCAVPCQAVTRKHGKACPFFPVTGPPSGAAAWASAFKGLAVLGQLPQQDLGICTQWDKALPVLRVTSAFPGRKRVCTQVKRPACLQALV